MPAPEPEPAQMAAAEPMSEPEPMAAPEPAMEAPPAPMPPEMAAMPAPEPEPASMPGSAPEIETPRLREDLTRIEGIGPAIANALQEAGVMTFQQLADTKADRIREIMRSAGIRGGDPTTWARQAKLAAAGDWVKLKKLQDQLTGGRRS